MFDRKNWNYADGSPMVPKPPPRSHKTLTVVLVLFTLALLYQTIAWAVFQWRNPLSNEMSYFRNFVDVATWQKLPEYQP